jgi:hypothetical protein
VVAPNSCLIVAKRQPISPGHDHRHGSQQPLRVLMQAANV